MKTEYELWHWPTDDGPATKTSGRYTTVEAAMGAAGYPLPNSWVMHTGSGNLTLASSIVFQLGRDRSPWLIAEEQVPETDMERIDLAIRLAVEYGQTDGDHHKMWVIDQMVRLLAGDRYDEVIAEACDGEDGPDTYGWDEGIAP